MNLDIIEYLNSNGIIVGEENFPRIKNKKKEWNVKNQISLIIEVQKILKGKKSYIIPRIESSIGHEIESFIVQTKKISKMIKLYEEKYYKYDFDYFIIEEGNKILARANRTINALDENMYLKLILRSMNNYEICLGKVDEGNLKKDGMIICIRSTRYISYNMLEHDCYNYIKRLKKKGYSGNVMEIVNDFSQKSGLGNESIDYIRVLVNYPIEAIKILSKIKYDRSRFTNDEWVKEINMSQRIDGIELL